MSLLALLRWTAFYQGALPPQVQNRRLYDLYITYDLVYKVPRFWLVGFDASLSPLTSEQVEKTMHGVGDVTAAVSADLCGCES